MNPHGVRLVRTGLLAAALVLGGGAGALLDLGPSRETPTAAEPVPDASGNDAGRESDRTGTVAFELTSQHGKRITAEQLRGRVLLVFFGYTHCPDICPTTLVQMKLAREQLGTAAGDFQGVFITVDPARDTEARLRDYVGHFDTTLLGLTGADEEIAAAARSFGAFYERGDAVPGGYLMGHTAFGYLVDRDGRIGTLFPNDAALDDIVTALKSAIARGDA
ncbi:MAG: SCO family protein [Pseudomonadota bacterium]